MSERLHAQLTDADLEQEIGRYFDGAVVGADASSIARDAAGRGARKSSSVLRMAVAICVVILITVAALQVAPSVGSFVESLRRMPVPPEGAMPLSMSGATVAIGLAESADGSLSLGQMTSRQLEVTELTSDGSIDTASANGGRHTIDIPSTGDFGPAALLADGSLVVARNQDAGVALQRYGPDGSLDPTFEADPTLTFSFRDEQALAYAIAVQSDGRILLVGRTTDGKATPIPGEMTGINPDAVRVAVARFEPSGAIDTSFGEDGSVSLQIAAGIDDGNGLAVQDDGRILIVGSTGQMTPGPEDNDAFIARLTADGTLDETWGETGVVRASFNGGVNQMGQAVAVQDDGKVILLGQMEPIGMWIGRYLPDGTEDEAFAFTEWPGTAVGRGSPLAIAVQVDGKIVIAGQSFVMRLNEDLSQDTEFGDGGVVSPRSSD